MAISKTVKGALIGGIFAIIAAIIAFIPSLINRDSIKEYKLNYLSGYIKSDSGNKEGLKNIEISALDKNKNIISKGSIVTDDFGKYVIVLSKTKKVSFIKVTNNLYENVFPLSLINNNENEDIFIKLEK